MYCCGSLTCCSARSGRAPAAASPSPCSLLVAAGTRRAGLTACRVSLISRMRSAACQQQQQWQQWQEREGGGWLGFTPPSQARRQAAIGTCCCHPPSGPTHLECLHLIPAAAAAAAAAARLRHHHPVRAVHMASKLQLVQAASLA